MTTEQDRQAAVEALQRVLTRIGINAAGSGCSQWTAQDFLSRLEVYGFTIVRKEQKNTLDNPSGNS